MRNSRKKNAIFPTVHLDDKHITRATRVLNHSESVHVSEYDNTKERRRKHSHDKPARGRQWTTVAGMLGNSFKLLSPIQIIGTKKRR